MKWLCVSGMCLARLFLAAIFVLAGIGKIMNYDQTAEYMLSKGMTMVPFFLIAAAVIELVFGLFLAIGFKARLSAFVLMLFLIPTTLIFHDFWNVAPPMNEMEMISFLKNLAIFGGLLAVVSTPAWPCKNSNIEIESSK